MYQPIKTGNAIKVSFSINTGHRIFCSEENKKKARPLFGLPKFAYGYIGSITLKKCLYHFHENVIVNEMCLMGVFIQIPVNFAAIFSKQRIIF